MKARNKQSLLAAALMCALACTAGVARAAVDPLPSWNDGNAKKSIITFVEKVTTRGSLDFVPEPERKQPQIDPAAGASGPAGGSREPPADRLIGGTNVCGSVSDDLYRIRAAAGGGAKGGSARFLR
jgi:hypothetical protein